MTIILAGDTPTAAAWDATDAAFDMHATGWEISAVSVLHRLVDLAASDALIVPPGHAEPADWTQTAKEHRDSSDHRQRGWSRLLVAPDSDEQTPEHHDDGEPVLVSLDAVRARPVHMHAGRRPSWESFLTALQADVRARSDSALPTSPPVRTDKLEPLHLASRERSGTTAVMNLLRASPHTVADGVYPFEDSWLAYIDKMMHMSRFAGQRFPSPLHFIQQFDMAHPALGPPQDRSSLVDEDRFATEALHAAWGVYSRLAREKHPDAHYYIDKRFVKRGTAVSAFTPRRRIIQVRDPRDRALSMIAGRNKGLWTEADKGETWERFFPLDVPETASDWARQDPLQTTPGELTLVVRYEDIVGPDAEMEQRRLSAWLASPVSTDTIEDTEFRDYHATSKKGATTERWRTELTDAQKQDAAVEYSTYLLHYGYPLQ